MIIKRGQIFDVYLDPVFGREMGGYKARPVVVISINDTNGKPLAITVVPGTSASGKPDHFRNVALIHPTHENGLTSATIFRGDQIRAIDRGRFTSRLRGHLSPQDLQAVLDAVAFNIGTI